MTSPYLGWRALLKVYNDASHVDSYGSGPITNLGLAQYSLTILANPGYDLTGSDTPNYVPEISSTHGVVAPGLCANGTYR